MYWSIFSNKSIVKALQPHCNAFFTGKIPIVRVKVLQHGQTYPV